MLAGFQQKRRHVVVLRGAGHEPVHSVEQAVKLFLGRQLRILRQDGGHAGASKFLTLRRRRLRDTIGIKNY